ncbi:hypothetical protein AgCh_011489 [Apium graveolens]
MTDTTETKGNAGKKVSFTAMLEDFVPPSSWSQDSDSHYLVLHLPGFKKEEVRLQVNNRDEIITSGERQTDGNKLVTRFQKTFKIPENSVSEKITGKFEAEGLLREEDINSFNLPTYNPSPAELEAIIESESSFSLARLETFEVNWNACSTEDEIMKSGNNNGMGETENNEVEKDKQEKKEKHADEDGKGEKGEKTKDKDKKKKDKSGKEEKKKKSPEDKKDPAYLKSKLEKLDVKIKDLVTKKEEMLKLLQEAEANPPPADAPPATA